MKEPLTCMRSVSNDRFAGELDTHAPVSVYPEIHGCRRVFISGLCG